MLRSHRRAALTLIEMLVVVALLAVLLSVLLPALTQARNRVVEVQCESNLRLLGVGFDNYVTEHGVFPPPRSLRISAIGQSHGLTFAPSLPVSASSPNKSFRCPGDEIVFPFTGTSYFYNTILAGRGSEAAASDGRRWMSSRAATAVLWDADETMIETRAGRLYVPPFHNRRNALYADWSVGPVDGRTLPVFSRRSQ